MFKMQGVCGTLGLLLLAATVAACDDFSPVPPNSPIVQGVIVWVDHPFDTPDPELRARFVFPDSVRAGVAFDARLITIGPNVCWFPDDATVSTSGNRIEVTPWDRAGVPGQRCTPANRSLQRFVRMTFPEAGSGTVVLIGRRVSGNDPGSEPVLGEPHQLEFVVEVIP